jgi:hypothetical protein
MAAFCRFHCLWFFAGITASEPPSRLIKRLLKDVRLGGAMAADPLSEKREDGSFDGSSLPRLGVFPSGSNYRPRLRRPQARGIHWHPIAMLEGFPRLDCEPSQRGPGMKRSFLILVMLALASRAAVLKCGETAGLSATTATSRYHHGRHMPSKSPFVPRLQPRGAGMVLLFQ